MARVTSAPFPLRPTALLEQLEHKFHDGDPVREAIAIARRTAAAQLVAAATIGDMGPKSSSEPNAAGRV